MSSIARIRRLNCSASHARSLGITTDQVADSFGHTDIKTTLGNAQLGRVLHKRVVLMRVAGAIEAAAGAAPVLRDWLKFRRVRPRRRAA